MALHNALINFTPITDTISSKSFHKLSDICDNLMIHVAAEGVSFQAVWPYSIHLLAHIYADDILNRVADGVPVAVIVPDFYGNPYDVKESQPEVVAAWRIAQKLWTRDYAGVYEAVRDLYTANMFHLLLSAYSTIDVKEAAIFLGMSENEAAKYVLQEGWTLDPASQMLTVKKQPVIREQKLDQSKLQRLTEYVFHLEH
ncbi:hypothetical protein V2J09_015174 [Rumex salicifolius]